MSTTTTSKTERPGWDKRAWILAAVFSVVIGALILPDILGFYNDVDLSGTVAGQMVGAGFILCLFIFPPILSGIARRWTLLWAYMPEVLLFSWLVAAVCIAIPMGRVHAGSGGFTIVPSLARALMIAGAVFIASPLVTAGPVCLIRYLIKRAKYRNQARAVAIEQAMRAQREGVWPPPPTDGAPTE